MAMVVAGGGVILDGVWRGPMSGRRG
jgi:hypothetical protein